MPDYLTVDKSQFVAYIFMTHSCSLSFILLRQALHLEAIIMTSIDQPLLLESKCINDDWTVFPAWLPIPAMGALAVNSFLLKGREPLLVDTGLGALGQRFIAALENEIDLSDLRWIWLSHMDADHIGNLVRVLEGAPTARVVTNFVGMGKMNLAGLDISRVHVLEPGAVLEVGEHRLRPLRPPYYDAPETMGFLDETSGIVFAADCFGALLPEMVEELGDVAGETLRDGLLGWSSIDAPWLAMTDQAALARSLNAMERLAPDVLLSSHLPLASNGIAALAGILAEAYCHGSGRASDPLSLESVAATLSR